MIRISDRGTQMPVPSSALRINSRQQVRWLIWLTHGEARDSITRSLGQREQRTPLPPRYAYRRHYDRAANSRAVSRNGLFVISPDGILNNGTPTCQKIGACSSNGVEINSIPILQYETAAMVFLRKLHRRSISYCDSSEPVDCKR